MALYHYLLKVKRCSVAFILHVKTFSNTYEIVLEKYISEQIIYFKANNAVDNKLLLTPSKVDSGFHTWLSRAADL